MNDSIGTYRHAAPFEGITADFQEAILVANKVAARTGRRCRVYRDDHSLTARLARHFGFTKPYGWRITEVNHPREEVVR